MVSAFANYASKAIWAFGQSLSVRLALKITVINSRRLARTLFPGARLPSWKVEFKPMVPRDQLSMS